MQETDPEKIVSTLRAAAYRLDGLLASETGFVWARAFPQGWQIVWNASEAEIRLSKIPFALHTEDPQALIPPGTLLVFREEVLLMVWNPLVDLFVNNWVIDQQSGEAAFAEVLGILARSEAIQNN